MTAAPPAWVAALPSDDDDEVDDEQQPGRLPVAPTAVVDPDCYIVEDDDVQVVNVIKHEEQRRQQRGAESVTGQYAYSRQQFSGNVPLRGQLNMDVRGGEVYRFGANHHEHVEPSPRKRRREEVHQQNRLWSSKSDVQRGRSVVDGGMYHLSTEVAALDSVSQFRAQRTLVGGSGAFSREQRWITTGVPQVEFRPQGLGRGLTSVPTHEGYPHGNKVLHEHCSNVGGSVLREYGALGGGLASQVRERGTIGAGPPLQKREHAFLVPEREHIFAATGCERLAASRALIHGTIERENFVRVGAPDLRAQGHLRQGPVATPYSLEKMVSGKTMDDWWSSLRQSVGTNLSRLHWDIVSFCKSLELTPEQMQVRREGLEYVEISVRELWPSAEVHLFGSTATGLALPWSDIDVAIISSHQHIVGQKSKTVSWLSELGRQLKLHGQCKSLRQIPHAKVPLLKVVFKSGLACDISFDAHNGPRGVPVIRQFMEQYETLHPLCLVLKFFLRQENLNELWTGGLGSFCLITMVVSHLQKLGVTGSGHDLGVLLLSFFTRYTSMHNYRTDVVSTRAEFCVSKQAKGWVSLKDPELLSVEDPLDPTSDIAKGSYKIQDVRSKFLKAKFLLLTHWHHESVLAKLVDPTRNPKHGPKVQVETGQIIKQGKQKKRKKCGTVQSDMVDGQPIEIRRKQKSHSKHGNGLAPRKPRKQKSGSKKKKGKRVGKDSHVERILIDFWDSNSNPRTGSKKRARR